MKIFRLLIIFICFAPICSTAQVTVAKSATGWELKNGQIRLELTRSAETVRIKSLRRNGGAEWAVEGTSLIASPDQSGKPYRYVDDAISELDRSGKQLTLRFQSDRNAVLSLQLKLYPTGAVIQTAMRIENHGQGDLAIDPRIDSLFLTLATPRGGLTSYSSVKGNTGSMPSKA